MASHTSPLSSALQSVRKLATWCNTVEASLILLLILFLLRVPNLAEPYWYGDEAIYLTIGTALRTGGELYATIVDHKTPLIYYFAMTPTQFWFRILLFVWMSVSTLLFYGVARRFFSSSKVAFFSALLFVLLTSWPGLEGNIPNGELFVMGFVIASLWAITQTTIFQLWKSGKELPNSIQRQDFVKIFAAGVLASLGLLTKVPAILDIGALGFLLVSIAIPLTRKNWVKNIRGAVTIGAAFTVGVALPVLLSILYYFLRGNLDAYLEFGLLYNFHYVGTWVPSFSSPIVAFFFTLPGKALLLILGLTTSTVLFWTQPKFRLLPWTTFWLLAALFASLLSNRPYPHYFLQLIPPFALFVPLLLLQLRKQIFAASFGFVALGLIIAAAYYLDFGLYPTISYYERYTNLLSGKITPEEYAQQFNGIIEQNSQVAKEIVGTTSAQDTIFIWGTNPMLYALTQRVPANRFTVAFHIHDLKVYDQTLEEIKQAEPAYIVVMRKESAWPELEDYIFQHYILTTTTNEMQVYRRTRLTSLLL